MLPLNHFEAPQRKPRFLFRNWKGFLRCYPFLGKQGVPLPLLDAIRAVCMQGIELSLDRVLPGTQRSREDLLLLRAQACVPEALRTWFS